ncbi:MAG: hypothetical protein JRJ09_06465 [Deltaproteobacteria bacterium]|nr:hypothetical protein [Deltaproteobacteria bacterium]MBW2111710.1 hypothetical protein [Deltaproteobacteria bacterium]MBW2354310.1 hypothetical protein [Deltaproteobacteria bacterium]
MVLRNTDNTWNGCGDQEGYRRWLLEGIEDLRRLTMNYDADDIRAKLKELLPEYQPQDRECVL